MRPISRSCPALVVAALAALVASPARAAWPNQPNVNLPLCRAIGEQNLPVIASDAAGGAFVAWSDQRTGFPPYSDVYVQHVTGSGAVDAAWPVDGRKLTATQLDSPVQQVAPDGAGGAFVTWGDSRSGSWQIYVQHLPATGAVDAAWPATGLAVTTGPISHYAPVITPDGSNGALICSLDQRTAGAWSLYVHHVLGSGTVDPAWPVDGRAICTGAVGPDDPEMVPDGSGGAIVAWEDGRALSYDIYAQHIRASGVVDPAWPVNGRALCAAANDQRFPVLVADGAGGAVVAWLDRRAGVTTSDIYAQHVLASGHVDAGWPAEGYPVCNYAGIQDQPQITTDGGGGALVVWRDSRGLPDFIYAQHVFAAGWVDPAWPSNGRSIATPVGNQAAPAVVSDGSGGALVAWHEYRGGSSNSDIVAQHVPSSGAPDPAWPSNGRVVSAAPSWQSYPVLAFDGAGGAIIAFDDLRSQVANDIYAQRVEAFGRLGDPQPVIANVKDVPNDNGGHVKLSWNASYLDAPPYNEISSYEVWRSVPPAIAQAALRAGAVMVRAGEPTPPTPGHVLKTTSQGAQVVYWEYIGLEPARRFPGYSMNVQTSGDSIGGSNPLTQFLVEARDNDNTSFWNSAAVAGYSVDNLPPFTPAAFLGAYAAGAAHLHWLPNTEADLAGYRLYRGSSPEFVPDPANRIASPADTGYTDAASATFVYKLTAIDSHGNESPVATLVPAGIAGIGEGAALTFSFASPAPNPAIRTTSFRFALPRAGHVGIVVHDVQGRVARSLEDAEFAAGDHAISWDLRDGAGRACRAGLYFARLECAEGTLVRRLVIGQ